MVVLPPPAPVQTRMCGAVSTSAAIAGLLAAGRRGHPWTGWSFWRVQPPLDDDTADLSAPFRPYRPVTLRDAHACPPRDSCSAGRAFERLSRRVCRDGGGRPPKGCPV
jgi:hypothetical protein